MQRKLTFKRLSEEEEVKSAGLFLDFDEIARKGSMTREEASIAKWYGIYNSRQTGNCMVRIVIPGGQITASQGRTIAEVAERYGQGRMNITTRQAIQYHWLKIPNLPLMMRELAEAGLTTYHGCGDVTRNVAACPMAENCRYKRFDVLPYARESARYLSDCRDLDNLPRKYKITWSGCGAACAQPYINCLGMIAVDKGGKMGFKAVIGGGMGWKAFTAEELFSFVPEDRAIALSRSVGLLFRDHGDRFNRAKSRLKFVVNRYGIEKCREIVLENLRKEGISTEGLETAPVADQGPMFPERPLTEQDPVGTDGKVVVRIRIPKGELSFRELQRIAEFSEVYANQRIYTTNRQNIELHGVDPSHVAELKEKIENMGFYTQGLFHMEDMVACVGTTYCPKAVTATRSLFDSLYPVVQQERYSSIRDKVIINITGCPNSCSPYRIADIGFRGARIREEMGSVEAYEVLVGGTQQQFGLKLGDFKAIDCPQVLSGILDTFLKLRQGEESLAACVARTGIEPFKTVIEYNKAPLISDYSIFTGIAVEERDRKALKKDIPCQKGCPVHTDVPAYIEQIALGNYLEAYKINLEDNVFPGVLGRICTHPCQDECRHNWTDTGGTVRICHLKRAAADRTEAVVPPLAPYSTATGKKAAVIGGGPAGLSAARELARWGHSVTVYEREEQLGGMMVHGIPRFRLPMEVVEKEIRQLISCGITVKSGIPVDEKRFNDLVTENDAVLVATGTTVARMPEMAGLSESNAVVGLDFMKQYNAGRITSLEGDVVVIGGGFTAVDCARACARAAGRILKTGGRVSIYYRRTEEFMAADKAELEEIEAEQILIRTLVSPVSVKREGDRIKAVVLRKNRLVQRIKGDKPVIEEIPGSDFEVPCDHLIIAIGQSQDYSLFGGAIKPVPEKFCTDHPRVFVAGDFATGSQDVINAVSQGKKAARKIDSVLMGSSRIMKGVTVELLDRDGETGRFRDHDLQNPAPMPMIPVALRSPSDSEVERGFTEEQALINATRCYYCHYKFEIDQDKCIHCDWCIGVTPRDCIKRVSRVFKDSDGFIDNYVEADLIKDGTYIWIDSRNCIRCGKCLRVCPTGAITMRKANRLICPEK